MNSRPEAWLKQAHNDLALARLANDNGFLAQACYYSSQAAEKALKGALLELGVEVSGIEALPLRGLSRMAIQSRYPMDATPPSELFDRVDAEQAIQTARKVLSHVELLDQ